MNVVKICGLFLIISASLAYASHSLADEPFAIVDILAHPQFHHLQRNTLREVALKVYSFDPSERLTCRAKWVFCQDAPGFVPETVVPVHCASTPRESPEEASRPQGQIDFTTFRLISSGMTRGEVLKLAGPPQPFSYGGCLFCSYRWVYYRDDGWIVEVSFNDFNQVISVKDYRPH